MARLRDAIPNTGVASALLVLLVASCGSSQSSTTTAGDSTEAELAAIPEVVAPVEQATEVAAASEVAAPVVPAKLLTRRLAQSSDGAKRILSKQCQEVDGQCLLSTVTLAIDGTPIAFRPEGTSSDAPFGEWDSLEYRSGGEQNAQLLMEFANDYSYVQVNWKASSFEAFEAKSWPKMLEGVLLESSDWDGDGSTEAIHYRCRAFASRDTPKDCIETTIYSGDRELLTIEDEVISSDILVTAMPGNALRIVTEPLEEEYDARYIQILKMLDGRVTPVWDHYASGAVQWNKDQSWSLTTALCDRPARFDYDDETGNETLLKFGRERFDRTRYSWTGDAMKTTVEKKWSDRKSRCQSEGRCPYVYAGASQTKLGEILRDQVGTQNWRNESIKVPRSLVDKGELLIRIAEEKPDEVTYLDDVWLQVGQQKLRPRRCPAGVCGTDRETMSLAPGESIELHFAGVPETGEIRLFANGYYRYIR